MQRCAELEYLQACIEEILRIDAPVKVGLPRVTPPEGMAIDGKFVPGEVTHPRPISLFPPGPSLPEY